jgi:uncharacterized protein YrrD
VKASRKFLSLPVITVREGQHLGSVKGLILDASSKTLAALLIDPKGFFKDQKIIPYHKIVSVGDDALTIDKGSQAGKATNLPDLLDLIKDKMEIIGAKVVTETGKNLGIVDEYYIDTQTGVITSIEISGGRIEGLLNGKAMLNAEHVLTIGHDVIVAEKGSEERLITSDKGFGDTVKHILHSTSKIAGETSQNIGNYIKKDRGKDIALSVEEAPDSESSAEATTEEAPAIPADPSEIPADAVAEDSTPENSADHPIHTSPGSMSFHA